MIGAYQAINKMDDQGYWYFDDITGVMDLNDYACYLKNVLGIDTNLEQISKAAVEIMNKHYATDIPAKEGMVELVKRVRGRK